MEPKYSILLCNQIYTKYEDKISEWLYSGIKVFWFGESRECTLLKEKYSAFAKRFFLQVYTVELGISGIVTDGKDENGLISVLERTCPMFNAAQYLVEHCQTDEHIVVQASAGTGKTTVMIDRIMFLMHMVPGLEMSDIYMITFTNDATNQMNMRLQDMLMDRFHLTGNMRYFRWVEQQSQMNISTIHSFAYLMLKEYGIGQSFTGNMTIRDFKYERKELIKDMMDEKTSSSCSIKEQIGVPLYKANSLVENFWSGFAKLGISHEDMVEMNWGKAVDGKSVAFQNLISETLVELDDDYFDIKRDHDSIALNDIMRDLQKILMSPDITETDLSMKYLFIDEFQDSDLSQIKVAAMFVKLLGAKLFVVGDVKQSIYRFRGANDQAFSILAKDLKEVGARSARQFILKNNYRTAANIMNRMNAYFQQWGEDRLLQYDGPVVPFNQKEGMMKMIPSFADQEEENKLIVRTVREQLDSLIERVEGSGKKASEKDRVVLLSRTNNELHTLETLLKKNKIPASITQEGSFYKSNAVRDFFAMISSYMFVDEPKYIFQFLFTPYAGEIDPMDINLMEQLGADPDKLAELLDPALKQTNWEQYYKEFRLRPVMAVIKSMLEREPVLENFVKNSKMRKREAGWEEEQCNAATRAEAVRYQANLEKLQEVLQDQLGGEKVSLYDVYHYLQLQIATNRSESEASVEIQDDYRTVLCMTVHKSKGLEFDTVVIPYTHRRFPDKYNTEILIDPATKKVGWNFVRDRKNLDMRNNLYASLKEEDIYKTKAEETRILYVAMTRAIRRLICIVHPPKDAERWSYLIEEVGVDDE